MATDLAKLLINQAEHLGDYDHLHNHFDGVEMYASPPSYDGA